MEVWKGKKLTITTSSFTKTSRIWQFHPRCFPPLPWRWSGDRKILPAPGTNQIAGFSGYRPLTIKEINNTGYFQRKFDKSGKERFITWNIDLIKSQFAITASTHQLPCLCSRIVKGMFEIVLDVLLRTLNIKVFRFTGLEKTGNLLDMQAFSFCVYQRPNPNNFVCSLIYYLKCLRRSFFFLLGDEVMNGKHGSHFYFQTSTTSHLPVDYQPFKQISQSALFFNWSWEIMIWTT